MSYFAVEPRGRTTMPIGSLYGGIIDADTSEPIQGALVSLNTGLETITETSFKDGAYLLDAPPGLGYELTAAAAFYAPQTGCNARGQQGGHASMIDDASIPEMDRGQRGGAPTGRAG